MMIIKVVIANKDQHARQIWRLYWEHLQWVNAKVKEKYEKIRERMKIGPDLGTVSSFLRVIADQVRSSQRQIPYYARNLADEYGNGVRKRKDFGH